MQNAFFVLERVAFTLHDSASFLLGKYLFTFKKILLVVAHFSLLGFFLPEMRREFGELSANILIALLFLSPLARITRMRLLGQMMSLRREMGILMGYLALVHGVGYMIDPAWGSIIFPLFPLDSVFGGHIFFFYGIMALLLTLPLLITSNNFSQKYMGGKNWKRLHRTVYAMFAFTILHRFFQREDLTSFIEALILAGSYILLKVHAWKPFLPFVNNIMVRIGADYKAFLLEKKPGL